MNKKEKYVFYLETFILTLSFIAVILVLSQMFGRSINVSLEAKRLNDAVILSGNTAEVFKSCKDKDDLDAFLKEEFNLETEGEDRVIYFNDDLKADKNGDYKIVLKIVKDDELKEALIKAYYKGEEIYDLEVASYKETIND
ncbi:MAG: hypothetical protein IJJ00_07575 [Erysipelotrichaceae bacterium]|nr:hypothetical protein [Erysipelotrichaceae bacterium]